MRQTRATWAVSLAGILGVLMILFGATPAGAQEEATVYEECRGRTDDAVIATKLVESGVVPESELGGNVLGAKGVDHNDAQEIKANYPEEWERQVAAQDERGALRQGLANAWDATTCRVAQPVESMVSAAQDSEFWDTAIGEFTRSVMEGNTEALRVAMTFWMDFSTTSVDIAGNTQGVKNIVMGLAGFALVASFIVSGYRMASARRGGLQGGLEDMNDNMVRWLIYSIAVPVLVPGAMLASDALADEIMSQFGTTSADTLVNLGGLENTQAGPWFTLILTLVAMAGSLVQIIALVTRVLLVPIAAGLTPLFAALSFSDTGRQGLAHLQAFLIAGIVFKPVSALLYSVVLWNVSQAGDIGVAGGVINALMIGIAGFTAPALVFAIVPLARQAGGGGASPILAGATGAVTGAAGGMMAVAGRGASQLGGKMGGQSATGTGAAPTATRGGNAGGSAGGNAAGSGAGTAALGGSTPSGGGGGSARGQNQAAQPTGAAASGGAAGGGAAGGGASTGRGARGQNQAAQPTGAAASGGASTGRGARGAARSVGRGARAVAGGALKGVGTAAQVGGRAVGQGGNRIAHDSQRIFDESIGVPGHYAGQAHR